jgi:uncharacterized protein (UPF0303 family)
MSNGFKSRSRPSQGNFMTTASPISDDRARIAEQERRLVFSGFDTATAWSLGTALRAMAEARKAPVVIDIRRFGDPHQQLFFTALPGTTPDNARWIQRKLKVVARFHRSSYAAGLYLAEQGVTFEQKYSLPEADYATHGGAFPITLAGTGVIGAVTVSGLPQRADHELVVEALCAELKLDYADLRLPARP